MSDWELRETNTHQDHVIAHILGATIQGFFAWDETAYLLLDIGFIWNVYLDGEMGLVPYPVAINELSASDELKQTLKDDIDCLVRNSGTLTQLKVCTLNSPIQQVDFFERENDRRLLLICEDGAVVVETSLDTAEVKIYES